MGRELNDVSQVVAAMPVIVAIEFCVNRRAFARLGNAARRRWGPQTT
jgi:hypothetical protein